MTMQINNAENKIVYDGRRLDDNSIFYHFEAEVPSS